MAVKNTTLIVGGTTVLPVKMVKATTNNNDLKFELVSPNGEAVEQVYRDPNGDCFKRNECERAFEGHIVPKEQIEAIDEECKLQDLDALPVPEADIDWHLATSLYFCEIDPKATGAVKSIFRAVFEALRAEKMVLVTKWTPRSRQSPLVLKYDGEKVLAVELCFKNDLREPDSDVLGHLSAEAPREVVKKARELVKLLAEDGEVYTNMRDEGSEKRRELVDSVIKGDKVIPTKKADRSPARDLMEELDRALAANR